MATPIVEYNVSNAAIAELKSKYGGLTADTPQGYEDVKTALKEVSGYRIAVENKRKELKADALEYGRKVDAEAKRIQALIAEVEEPLKLEKKKVDDEKDRIAREKVEAERRELERLRAEEQARKEAAEQAERAKRICRKCNGEGQLYFNGPHHSSAMRCDICQGEGKI